MQKHNNYIDEIGLSRVDNFFKAAICCYEFSFKSEYEELTQQLSIQERYYYDTLKFDKRRQNFLIGRFAAKQAVAALIDSNNLKNIIIQAGVFTQPIVNSSQHNIQISITHCGDFEAEIAFPEAHPMGIDIERVSNAEQLVLEGQLIELEKERLEFLPYTVDQGLMLAWTAKEALSKVLKTGLRPSPLRFLKFRSFSKVKIILLVIIKTLHNANLLPFRLINICVQSPAR